MSKSVFPESWLPIMRVIEFIGVLVAIVVVLFDFIVDRPTDRIIRAWIVIAQSPGADGNIGQSAALTALNNAEQDIRGINLTGAWLVGADLREFRLDRASLVGAKLMDSSLVGAVLNRANLKGANLTNADLRDADLTGTDLRFADLTDANLAYANLAGAILASASLRGANLTGASLAGAILTGADLVDANLTEAKFEGARELPFLSGACADPNNLPTGLAQRILNTITKLCSNAGQ